jgi:hypothetical protein
MAILSSKQVTEMIQKRLRGEISQKELSDWAWNAHWKNEKREQCYEEGSFQMIAEIIFALAHSGTEGFEIDEQDNVISELVRRILLLGIASPEEIQGCTKEEVEEIQAYAGVKLPAIYLDFLYTMGRGAGNFFKGSDMFYPSLLGLRKAAEELLSEEGASFSLPKDAFVFLMHQGYQFLFFRTLGCSDDPPVYHYMEGEGAPRKISRSFSRFLIESIKEHEGS